MPTPYAARRSSYAVNGLNQYTSASGTSFGYDANGNLITSGTTSYGYDAENRLVSSSLSGGTTLSYDPMGRLWQTASPVNGKTRFVYEGDHVAVEYDGDTGGRPETREHIASKISGAQTLYASLRNQARQSPRKTGIIRQTQRLFFRIT